MFDQGLDPMEQRVWCSECNGYLYSVSRLQAYPETVKCPYVKTPGGVRTGEFPRNASRKEAMNV